MGGNGLSFRFIRRGGEHFRIADPSWTNPPSGRYAQQRGGRWNPPGSFPVVYLNAAVNVARANVQRRFAGLPYGPESLDPLTAPVLITTHVAYAGYVDILTDEGCAAAGLPETYPLDDSEEISWEQCQSIGLQAWKDEAPGIACRSAAIPTPPFGEELAWFERSGRPQVAQVARFVEWYWSE